MMNSIIKSVFRLILFFTTLSLVSCKNPDVLIINNNPRENRLIFAVEKLTEALTENGYHVTTDLSKEDDKNITKIFVGVEIREVEDGNPKTRSESYSIFRNENTISIIGQGSTGALYGCLEFIDRLKIHKGIPEEISIKDRPEMILRGTCIGLQKTEYLPGRTVYEYPYTPENFPWFYDKDLWIKYLDMLVENRYNSLYLWNGHPFASLVKLKDYPYAVEVDEQTFRLNKEMFRFITEEADKRGIWVIQMFYNIIVSKPFAEHHHIKTQERSREILPVVADYTRKSIAAFIEEYPNVGLMVCLGEAMNTIEDDIEWFTKTIIPGVRDGLNAMGKSVEPPIILRGHDTDAKRVMEVALPIYKNLYTTHKYNGESLTTYEPRGSWAEIHQGLSKLGSVHIANVHILANLEPFRYGSPKFIRKSVIAMHKIQGANGLHLYPQTSYWDWPYTADKTEPRLLQIDRDWLWYKTWARYAWKSDRNIEKENIYWNNQLSEYYGCGEYGKDIVKAYDEFGEIAPKLLRRFGISDGNRQTLLLGMFMSQLVNPYKWRVYQSFYDSNGPEGEILLDWADKEWNKKPRTGETPLQIIEEVVEHGKKAVEAIENAAPYVQKNKEEFQRIKNDVYCYNLFANYFAQKVKAAMLVLRYKYSNDVNDLEQAIPYLQKSVEYYSQLVNLTKDTYLYANSMQTKQRRIPIDGTNGSNKTWKELLPHYEDELVNFKRNVNNLKYKGAEELKKSKTEVLNAVDVEILSDEKERYFVRENELIYNDKDYSIKEITPELKNLKGVKLNFEKQEEEGTLLRFKNQKPVKVVVGYFNGHSYKILLPPTLETNAQANDRGQADIKIANAMDIPGLYPVNIYTYYYEPGENELKLNKGIVLILGFITGDQEIIMRDAGIGISKKNQGIDWLFY